MGFFQFIKYSWFICLYLEQKRNSLKYEPLVSNRPSFQSLKAREAYVLWRDKKSEDKAGLASVYWFTNARTKFLELGSSV